MGEGEGEDGGGGIGLTGENSLMRTGIAFSLSFAVQPMKRL